MVAAEVTRRTVARTCQEIRLVTSAATGPGDFSDTLLDAALRPAPQQCLAHLCGTLISLAGILPTGLENDRIERKHFNMVGALEERRRQFRKQSATQTRTHLVEHFAQTVKVRRRRARSLRRDVAFGAQVAHSASTGDIGYQADVGRS